MHLNKLLLIFWLCFPSLIQALPSDEEQPINIESDQAFLDDEKRLAQYQGNAIMTQGTLRITGDIITIYYDEQRQLIKAVTQGKLATYQQVHEAGEPPVKAKSLQMEYYAGKQKIYLIGQAHVWQKGDEFTGNKIEYDIQKEKITANAEPVSVNGETQDKGRIHVIIQPPSNREKATLPPTPAPTTPQQKTIESEVEPRYETADVTTVLNVRTGPGTQYDKIAWLQPGQTVTILSRQPNWVQIRAQINNGPVTGWVNKQFLK